MNKFTNISGVYFIISAVVLVAPVLSFLGFPVAFLVKAIHPPAANFIVEFTSYVFSFLIGIAAGIGSVLGNYVGYMVGFFSTFSGVVLLFTGFYLRTKFKNDVEKLRNIKKGICLNTIHILLLFIQILLAFIIPVLKPL